VSWITSELKFEDWLFGTSEGSSNSYKSSSIGGWNIWASILVEGYYLASVSGYLLKLLGGGVTS
jgi:hypothetical protein